MQHPIRNCKSQIFDFWELKEEDKKILSELYGNEQMENDKFVEFQYINGRIDILPLSMFMRNNNSRYHGSYCTSNTGGFAIIINKTNDSALISLF